jgi:hypothetical protein
MNRFGESILVQLKCNVPLQPKTNYGSKTFVHTVFKLWNFYLKNQPDLLTLGYTSFSRNMKKMLLADQLRRRNARISPPPPQPTPAPPQ